MLSRAIPASDGNYGRAQNKIVAVLDKTNTTYPTSERKYGPLIGFPAESEKSENLNYYRHSDAEFENFVLNFEDTGDQFFLTTDSREA